MKTIEQLAREAWQLEFIPESDTPKLQRFHSLAIAQYREGLLAGVGEPVVTAAGKGKPTLHLYTADQLAAAALRERDAMRAELAGAEAVNKAAALEIVSLRAELAAAKADITRQSAALLNIARKAEALKQPCGDDPESPTAIRNGRYMHLSYLARAAMKGQP